MSYYTRVSLTIRLPEPPNNIKDILLYLVGQSEIEPELPNHPFFETKNWDIKTHWTAIAQRDNIIWGNHSVFYEQNNTYFLIINSAFQDDDDLLDKFINWISPYTDQGDFNNFFGYSLGEADYMPTLYFHGRTLKAPGRHYISDENDIIYK